jgi:hypothetical protein
MDLDDLYLYHTIPPSNDISPAEWSLDDVLQDYLLGVPTTATPNSPTIDTISDYLSLDGPTTPLNLPTPSDLPGFLSQDNVGGTSTTTLHDSRTRHAIHDRQSPGEASANLPYLAPSEAASMPGPMLPTGYGPQKMATPPDLNQMIAPSQGPASRKRNKSRAHAAGMSSVSHRQSFVLPFRKIALTPKQVVTRRAGGSRKRRK